LTALSAELHFLKSPAMTQIRKFLSEGSKEIEDTCGDEAHAALTHSENSAVSESESERVPPPSLTASNRKATQAVIRSWLNAEYIEEGEELHDMLTELEVRHLPHIYVFMFADSNVRAHKRIPHIQAIEGQERMLNQQVGSVVGLLREREVEAERLRAELAASRFLCGRACLTCARLRVRMNELRIAGFPL
jgi:hypothetical protein